MAFDFLISLDSSLKGCDCIAKHSVRTARNGISSRYHGFYGVQGPHRHSWENLLSIGVLHGFCLIVVVA